jgi:hypothetical protein
MGCALAAVCDTGVSWGRGLLSSLQVLERSSVGASATSAGSDSDAMTGGSSLSNGLLNGGSSFGGGLTRASSDVMAAFKSDGHIELCTCNGA